MWDSENRIKAFASQTNNPSDLPNAIRRCADAFDDLRYQHEDPDKATYYLSDLPMFLTRLILEMRPEWNVPQDGKPHPPISQNADHQPDASPDVSGSST
jgi:hypothetical protein